MKKLISVLLVVVLITAFTVPAFATNTVSTNDGTANVELAGNVSPSAAVISVTIPTSIAFAIKTTAGDNFFEELTSGTGTVVNNGPTSVDINIVSVADPGALLSKVNLRLGGVALTTPMSTVLWRSISSGASADLVVSGTAKDASTAIDEGNYSVTTTLKVSATVTAP